MCEKHESANPICDACGLLGEGKRSDQEEFRMKKKCERKKKRVLHSRIAIYYDHSLFTITLSLSLSRSQLVAASIGMLHHKLNKIPLPVTRAWGRGGTIDGDVVRYDQRPRFTNYTCVTLQPRISVY